MTVSLETNTGNPMDTITSDGDLVGTGRPNTNLTITWSVDSVVVATQTFLVGSNGTWTATKPARWAMATSSVAVSQFDGLGVEDTASLVFELDSAAPAEPAGLDLDSISDTGADDEDEVTNANDLIIRGTAEAGATVKVFLDGSTTPAATTVAVGGNWSVTLNNVGPEGDREIAATATDVAGNESALSDILTVTVDGTAPAVSAPDLAAGSDSGRSSSDNVTNAPA